MDLKRPLLSIPEIEKKLLEAGVQPTAQRIAICRYVLCEADHPTADEVKKWADLNFPKVSMATVYNTLKTLVDSGILKEFKFSHSDSAIYDSNTTVHYHFLDEGTGELFDIEPEAVDVSLKPQDRFKVTEIQVLFRGTTK